MALFFKEITSQLLLRQRDGCAFDKLRSVSEMTGNKGLLFPHLEQQTKELMPAAIFFVIFCPTT